jgi:ABC-type glycerol-3-phosphate transport system permease component
MTGEAAALAVPRGWRIAFHAMLSLLALAVILPLAIVLGAAFKPASEMFSAQPWPDTPTLANFRAILTETEFALYAWNSLATTVLRVLGQLFIALCAAYAFARFEFRGRDLLFVFVLGAMLIPHQLTVVPTYILIAWLGWFDTWTALIVPNLATPFGALLIRQHLLSIPKPMFEAAALDGAGHFRILWDIALPMLLPVMSALAIVLFLECWNEYFWPLLVAPDPASRTLQVGLRSLLDEDYANYGALMAGVTLASLPALCLFALLHRRIMQAMAHSGVNG